MANEIKAKITADATGFTAGLKRASSALDGATQRWGRQFAGLNRGLAAFGGFVAGGVAAGALDAFAKSALDLGGAIDDAAKTAGIGAAALQEYRFAAKQSGLEVEALDRAISTFVRNLGEARRGNKALAETFARIGVVAADTNERALEKTFQFLAGVGDQAQRASLASELFGARAQRMATLVEGGAKTLSDFRQQARDLGIVLDDSLIAKADEAGDKIAALETAMKARLNKSVLENIDGFVKFKELLNDVSILMVQLAASTGEVAERFKRFFDQFPQFRLSDDAEIIDILKRRDTLTKEIEKNEKQLAAALNFENSPLGKAPFIGERNDAGIQFLKATLARQLLEKSALEAAIAKARAKAGTPAPLRSDSEEAPPGKTVANLANPFPGINAPTLKTDAFAKAAKDAGAAIEKLTAGARSPLESLRAQLAEIQGLMPFAENAGELAGLEKAAISLQSQMKKLQIETKLWGVSIDESISGLSDAFSRAIIYGDNLLGTLKNLVKQLAARALSNFLFKTISSAIGVPLPGLAAGGPVVGGRSYLVGEQGPEVFTPSVSGAIIPNGALSGGGVSVQVVNRFDVGLESVDQRIGTLTPAISASVVEAVQRAQSRPRYA